MQCLLYFKKNIAMELCLSIVTVLSKINTSLVYLARDRRRNFTYPTINLQKPFPEIVSRICSSGQSKSIDEINNSKSRSILALFHTGQECNSFLFSSVVIKIQLTRKIETYCCPALIANKYFYCYTFNFFNITIYKHVWE